MGPVVIENGIVRMTRMGFLFCIDAFPAFHQKRKGAISLCPAEFINLSLPPNLRYDPDNILIWLIVPNELSARSQLKYFKYLTTHELNPLQTVGLQGPDGPVQIKIFAASLDLKGKEKFYNQNTVGSYCGCSTCTIHFDEGPGGPIYAQARRYLEAGHALRNQRCNFKGQSFEFAKAERRGPARVKTTHTLEKFAMMARRLGVEHYLGQKGPMMLTLYRGIQYDKFNVLEWMHNMARSFDNILNFLTGDAKFEARARTTCKILGVFRDVWVGEPVFLSAHRTQFLRGITDAQIATGDETWCRRCLRIAGIRPDQREPVRNLRARVTDLRNRAMQPERIQLPNTVNPLPWKLTPRAREIVNQRVLRVIYPHYTPVCNIDNDSFINGAGNWRTASKIIAFLVLLVPVLRGFVTKFREGLRSLIYGLRILEGQSLSVREADTLNVERGSKVLKDTDVDRARILIIVGLCMIEGAVPVCLIVPAMHCLCHYPDGAALFGLLTILWMMHFGSYNTCE